ncbi:MAG: SGNH/GDSL hydrolase family protein, partial [Clostridia bacterium]
MRKMLDFIKTIAPKAQLFIATLTPVTKIDHTDTLDVTNNDVLDRNEVVIRLAKEYDLILDDLYSVVIGKSEYRQDDGYHYNDDGKIAEAKAIAEILK